ncbi:MULTISPECIES: toll/interleukin-1 receptor domain-containing protein [Xanthomonas]|uniref:toll/interleukin-1 receptor domain-containing protein n=1 Tax=Xanthomonas TaxID=338 RepID=UPI0009E6645B|nr:MULTISPECIES: toll/interleukin-1 receptor domain-containing protein [Xanthomonas]
MSAIYEIIIYSDPNDSLADTFHVKIAEMIEPFGLQLGRDVAWILNPEKLSIKETIPAVVLYLSPNNAPPPASLLAAKIPILPVASSFDEVSHVIPEGLRHLNCLGIAEQGLERGVSVLLETLNLLPRQRRIFLSYKRNEAKEAAVQLADALANRQFEVFLDTRGVPPAEDFQAQLWHRLCDCDVLLMLHTPSYFQSRWTSAEFGRALAKHIPVLNVTWPDDTPDKRTQTAARAELLDEEIDKESGRLTEAAIDRISQQLEKLRARSHAIRNINLISRLRTAVLQVGGQMRGQGYQNSVHIELADGSLIRLFPNIGVPTSDILHLASSNKGAMEAAVAYDEIGILSTWVEHLDWLGQHIPGVRWVKASNAAWQFADWRD